MDSQFNQPTLKINKFCFTNFCLFNLNLSNLIICFKFDGFLPSCAHNLLNFITKNRWLKEFRCVTCSFDWVGRASSASFSLAAPHDIHASQTSESSSCAFDCQGTSAKYPPKSSSILFARSRSSSTRSPWWIDSSRCYFRVLYPY